MRVEVKKFKRLDYADVNLGSINIFIGSNNSGKSSFIQAIQFAVSASQTLAMKKAPWSRTGISSLSLDSTEYLYSPTRYVEDLHHGSKLTGSKTSETRKRIEFTFHDSIDKSTLKISKGSNGGFVTNLSGKSLGIKLSNLNEPFCVYIPGLAGIPTEEKYEVPIAVKKSATRGDSNNYLRNILLSISKDSGKWKEFIDSLRSIYSQENVDVFVEFNDEVSEYISVKVESSGVTVPIDTIGTGMLQVIQIFAYIGYFKPKLILLDEPDAHIHPTKQRKLAIALKQISAANKDLKVIFSTHSRYILDALENSANVVHFKEGKAVDNIKGSAILMDIGAVDVEQIFANKRAKYIFATEDKVDDIDEKKEFLKKFLLANGLVEDEFVLHSYEGCTKVYFASLLESFVKKQIPAARVVLHIDRDQKIDSDDAIQKLKEDCAREGVLLFLTEYQEVESYFCLPKHISLTCGINITVAEEIYNKYVDELEGETRRKLSNFIGRERKSLSLNKKGDFDIAVLNSNVDEWIYKYKVNLTPGKELLGKIKNHLNSMGINSSKLLEISDGLKSDYFCDLLEDVK